MTIELRIVGPDEALSLVIIIIISIIIINIIRVYACRDQWR